VAAGRQPVKTRSNNRRAVVVRAAVEVFGASGYEGASLSDVAAAAGLAKGNLWYYFRTKEELLFDIVDDLHEQFVVLADTWTDRTETPRDALWLAARDHALLVCERAGQARVAYEDFRFLDDAHKAAIKAKRNRYEAALRSLVADLLDQSGDGPDPAALTRVLLGTLNWPYQWFTREGRASAEDVAVLVADAVVRSVDG
jgi:AcrR family transcriptional regulator